jgi:G protein-coupled receptor 19
LFLTTIMKPLIYMMYNSNFRRGCREVFCMSNMRCYRSHTYAITTASNIGKKNHVGVMPVDTGNRIAIQSPTFTFNRTVISEKTAWPVSASISTTYL